MEKWQIGVLLAIIIFIVFMLIYWQGGAEAFSEVFYLDQMAMKNSDPTYFKYSSWERDVDGNSPRDYYLENQTNYLNGFAPGYFAGDQLYVDHTGYLQMPPQYRPGPSQYMAKMPIQRSGSDGSIMKVMDNVPLSAASMQTITQQTTGAMAENDAINNAAKEGFY
jgi:hypothetical protein